MKNCEIETDEWRDKVHRAFERIKKLCPEHVIVAMVLAEKSDGALPLGLSAHSNTCSHVCADLLRVACASLDAANQANDSECEPHSQN